MNQLDWVRVVDYTNYHCRSWQRLYFPQRVVRFIRIVGKLFFVLFFLTKLVIQILNTFSLV